MALVIGNSNYDNAPALANPVRDATAVAASLKAVGFDVSFRLDVNQNTFGAVLLKFEDMLAGADVALFYFAGHGIQLNDENYLLSTNARVNNPHLIDQDGMRLNTIIETMQSKAGISLALIDACRDNPMANALIENSTDAGRSFGLTRGLAKVNTEFGNSLVAFATAPGNIALDGTGANSPFTAALLDHLDSPGVEVSTMLKRVTGDVMAATDGKQRPEVVASMAREFYFVEQNIRIDGDLVVNQAASDPEALATSLLEAAKTMPAGKPRIAALQVVQSRFPESAAAEIAGLMIARQIDLYKISVDEIAVDPFDRTQLSALDVDKAIEDARAQAAANLSPAEIEEALGLERSDVEVIQTAMVAMGYDLGTVDGVFGPKSREALKLLQLRQRVPQTGYLNRTTVSELLKAFSEAPKTYDGSWDLVIYRRWLRDDKEYAPNKKGTEEALAHLRLEHRNNKFFIKDYNYQTFEPPDPFADFAGGISDSGRFSVSGLVSYLFPDNQVKTAHMRRMTLDYQMPRIAAYASTFKVTGNVIESDLQFVAVLRRLK